MDILLLLIGVMGTMFQYGVTGQKTGLSYTDSLLGVVSEFMKKDTTGSNVGQVPGVSDCTCPVDYICLFDHGEPHCILKDESLIGSKPMIVSPLNQSPPVKANIGLGVKEPRLVLGGKIESVKVSKATPIGNSDSAQASLDKTKRQRYYRQMGMMGVGPDYTSVITPPRRYASNRPSNTPVASSSISRLFSNRQATPSNTQVIQNNGVSNTVRDDRRRYQMGTMGVASAYSDVIAPPTRREMSTSQYVDTNTQPVYPSNQGSSTVNVDRERYQMGTMGVAPVYSDVIVPPPRREMSTSQYVNAGNEPIYPSNEPVYTINEPGYPNNGDSAFSQIDFLRNTQMGVMGVPTEYSDVIVAPPRYPRHQDQFESGIQSSIIKEVKTGFGRKNLETKSPCSAIVPPTCWELTSDLTSQYRYSYSHVTQQCQKMIVCWECIDYVGVNFNLFHDLQHCKETCIPVY